MNKIELLIQNEQLYLGSILLEPSLLDEARLRTKDFHHPAHRSIFDAMMTLRKEGTPVTFVSLAELGESFILSIGGVSYLQRLAESVPSTESFSRYEFGIRNFQVVQKAVNVANHFLEQVKEVHNIKYLQELINNINKLEALTVKNRKTFQEMVRERMDYHYHTPAEGLTGITTGYAHLNDVSQGWQPTDLIIIGARPSMGKTAFIINTMVNTLSMNKFSEENKTKKVKVIFFSIEMAEPQIIDRLIAVLSGVSLYRLKNPNRYFDDSDWGRYSLAIGQLSNYEIEVRGENTIPEQRAIIRKSKRENPDHQHVIFIDYLTLMKTTVPKATRNAEIEDIVIDLKQMGKDFYIPIIALAQLSRELEKRNDKRPILSDLRDSGSIEQAADIVGFLYRAEKYDEKGAIPGKAELIIAKNRNGPLGTIVYEMRHQTNKFIEKNKLT